METSRRAFLRSLFVGTAAVAVAPLVVKPKSFFSFFTGLWKPEIVEVSGVTILPGNVLTLADWAKRMPTAQHMAKIADLLNEPCSVFDDLPWIEDNIPAGYETRRIT